MEKREREETNKKGDHQGREGTKEEAVSKFNKRLQSDKTRQITPTQ